MVCVMSIEPIFILCHDFFCYEDYICKHSSPSFSPYNKDGCDFNLPPSFILLQRTIQPTSWHYTMDINSEAFCKSNHIRGEMSSLYANHTCNKCWLNSILYFLNYLTSVTLLLSMSHIKIWTLGGPLILQMCFIFVFTIRLWVKNLYADLVEKMFLLFLVQIAVSSCWSDWCALTTPD
jgi:hypothetical protein